ncbi:flagellar export protein FliJ [Acidiferrimicrobium sp. IK]|uniref:flagellar export protein FliJ n=1 Tax=Acidiferrimicrobium sp. IK TaxID=2871700 RepID=UPI0021CB335D|nr:flagellar export protein FliJ [Acidiferrimicrobium sp. IK]MCU4185032.1 flagellar export protein FliJ [Acidiferrimicrobium sp. IK]
MSRPQRRLDAVLSARRAQEDVARLRLATANRELQHGRQVLDSASERYRSQPTLTGPCDVPDLLAAHQAAEQLAATVAHARGALSDAERSAHLRRGEWSEAAQRVAALERLVERRQREWQAEVQRREDQAVDDIVTSRWAPAGSAGDRSRR